VSSLPSPSDKINSVAEVMPQRDGKEGTADHLNEAPYFYQSSLDHGVFHINIPRKLSWADVEDVKSLFQLVERQMDRRCDSA